MNPDKAIRIWLLIAGKQYGINQAHDYRWADADTRTQEPYCTYRLMSAVPAEEGYVDMSTKSGNTVTHRYEQKHKVTVRVDLYRSQGGLAELAEMAIAAKRNPVIRTYLKTECGCEFLKNMGITNEMPDKNITQGELTEHYHYRMECTFDTNYDHSLEESNAAVDTIELQVESDMSIWEIDDAGYEEQ